ncbi:MAG: septum formation initiator family protein [Candidatus Aegiribacteria sp.]
MSIRDAGSRRTFYVILVSVFVLLVVILIFNRHGFMALAGLKGDVERMDGRIDSLRNEIDSLEAEISRLQNDSLYLERMVREVLGWGRAGEHIVRFVRPDSQGVLF